MQFTHQCKQGFMQFIHQCKPGFIESRSENFRKLKVVAKIDNKN